MNSQDHVLALAFQVEVLKKNQLVPSLLGRDRLALAKRLVFHRVDRLDPCRYRVTSLIRKRPTPKGPLGP